jgi:HD superfamily phosphohydrolase YqeK
MAGDIFISYRSSEAAAVGQLYDGLIRVGGFDSWQLWRDRVSLVAGKEWFTQIDAATRGARILIAIIGAEWRPKDIKGDWVTRELTEAFAVGIPVIPVLLGDASMPARDDLPHDLAPLPDMQALTVSNPPVTANFYELARACRRNGVKPARVTDPWSDARKFVDIDPVCKSLRRAIAHRGVVLLTGPPGSGRSQVLRKIVAEPPKKTFVGLHEPFHSSVRKDCAVLHDWLTSIFQRAREDPSLEKTLWAILLKSGLSHAAPEMVPLPVLSAGLPLDERLGLTGSALSLDLGSPGRLDGALPFDRAARLICDLANSAGRLVLLVDDFDFADAKSRDFIWELARWQRRLDDGQPSPFVLVLSTEDVAMTQDFLGVSLRQGPVKTSSDLDSFAKLCVSGLHESTSMKVAEKDLATLLTKACKASFEVEILLRHLYRRGQVVPSREGGWKLAGGRNGSPRLSLDEALDGAISDAVEPAMQQVLETGALVGMSFVASHADVATHGRDNPAPDQGDKSAWQQIMESDQDEVVVRCRTIDGREIITFTSAVWRRHLAARADPQLREKRTRALAARYAAEAGDRYGDWVTAGEFAARCGANDDAGRAYLTAARLGREQLSIDVAALRYRDAMSCYSLVAAATDDPAARAKALLVVAFASLQAMSLRMRAASMRSTPPDIEELRKELKLIARSVLPEIRHAAGRLPSAQVITQIESLALDLTDNYLCDADRLMVRCHSLAAHWAILSGQLMLIERPAEQRKIEWRFAEALRDAEQGLAGSVRRYLVVLAETGTTEALRIKADELVNHGGGPENEALSKVVARALFHASRALLLLERWRDLPDGPVSRFDIARARARLHDSVAALGRTRQLCLPLEPGPGGLLTPLADLTCQWSAALAPRRQGHMRRVAARASELVAAMTADARALCPDEDIKTMSYAHDLFRDVEPSRLLALFRELELPGRVPTNGGVRASAAPAGDGEPTSWIGCTEWTIPILLHGRLAAVFLDLVLDARTRLGSDRFAPIERALGSHTTGEKDAPPLSRLLVVADTLEVMSRDEFDGKPSCEFADIEASLHTDPDLNEAYGLAIKARLRHLDRIGTTPADRTIALAGANVDAPR